MATTQSNVRALELSFGGKKRPENLTFGGIQHVLVDTVVFDGTEQGNSLVELSGSIPVGSVIDLAASSVNNAALNGVVIDLLATGVNGDAVFSLIPSTSLSAAGEKKFNPNGGLYTTLNSKLLLRLLPGAVIPNAAVQIRIVYYVR